MRIVSLVPSATEMLFAIGAGDEVVAVTHECDFPPQVADLPRVTRDLIGPGLESREIDEAVRTLTAEGGSIYELDEDALRRLQPDLIVTQSLGAVRTLAHETDRKDEGVDLVQDAAARIDRVKLAVRGVTRRPRVAALEWLDPVFVAGHWTPQLIEYAGGDDVLGNPGEPSETIDWGLLKAASPEIVVVMPCGYDAERAREEAYTYGDELEELGARRIVAVDASAYFSRPGPRLVDGLELLAHVIHPDRVPEAPAE